MTMDRFGYSTRPARRGNVDSTLLSRYGRDDENCCLVDHGQCGSRSMLFFYRYVKDEEMRRGISWRNCLGKVEN